MAEEEKQYNKDTFGNIFITSFIASLVLIFFGGAIGSQFVMGLGVLALAPFALIMIAAIFFRFCTMIIEIVEIFRGKR